MEQTSGTLTTDTGATSASRSDSPKSKNTPGITIIGDSRDSQQLQVTTQVHYIPESVPTTRKLLSRKKKHTGQMPHPPFDLPAAFVQYFSATTKAKAKELITCLNNSFLTAQSKKQKADDIGIICKELLDVSSQENEDVRFQQLQQLEDRCITELTKTNVSDTNAKKLVACIWWCRLLSDEMSALQAMQCVPEAKLCHLTEEISRTLLFRTANPFLNCRLTMIRRHGAEHGDPKALTWLINRCLIDDEPDKGFSWEEGFRWLDTYRVLIKRKKLPEPTGNDLLSRLVRDGRAFEKCKTSAKEQLLAVGMYLDPRFGQIDRDEAEALLHPFFSQKNSKKKYTNWEMSLAWLWQGYLTMPRPYEQKTNTPSTPPASRTPSSKSCFRISVSMGCRDAEIKLLWLLLSLSHKENQDADLDELKKLVDQLAESNFESKPPEIWGPFDIAAKRVYPHKSEKTREELPKTVKGRLQKSLLLPSEMHQKKIESIRSQRLLLAACHGQPEARTIWLWQQLSDIYLSNYQQRFSCSSPTSTSSSPDTSEESQRAGVQTSRSLLKLLEHVDTDATTLVFRACGNGHPITFERDADTTSADRLLSLALDLDPTQAAILLAHLKIETTNYGIEKLGHYLCKHLPDITPLKRLAINYSYGQKALPEAPFNATRTREVYLEHKLAINITYESLQRLQLALLLKREEDKACRLCDYPLSSVQGLTLTAHSTLRKPEDIHAGIYGCIHEERVEKFGLAPVRLSTKADTLKAIQALIDQIPKWKSSLASFDNNPLGLWGNVLKARELIFHCAQHLEKNDVKQIIKLFREAAKAYNKAADKAEQCLVGMVRNLVMKKKTSLIFLEHLSELRVGGLDRASSMEQLYLPVADDSTMTKAVFFNLDKNTPSKLLDFAKRISPEESIRNLKELDSSDIPEFIWHMVRTLEEHSCDDAEWEQYVETLVTFTEHLILESREYCDTTLLDFMACLHSLCASKPDLFIYKHNLWRDLKELTGRRKNRQWSCNASIKCTLSGDHRRFYDEVERQLTPSGIAESLEKSFCNDAESFWERLKQVRKKTKPEIECIITEIVKLSGNTNEQTILRSRILTKLLHGQFDNDLWQALTAIPAYQFHNHYIYALALISFQMAFQDRLPDETVKGTFQVLERHKSLIPWYFSYLWEKNRGDSQEAGRSLLRGKNRKSSKCMLELARSYRNQAEHEKSIKICNTFANQNSFLFGDFQFELGEASIGQGESVTRSQRKAAYEYWSRACRYHHPVAFCRLFTCLYPQPDTRWCPDEANQWRDKAFILESLQLPSALPSAGRDVCRQLLLKHHKKPWDRLALENACEQLSDSEVLLLAQLPESFWPKTEQGADIEKQSLGSHLLERAVMVINNHRSADFSDTNIDVIEGIAVKDLAYYSEIRDRLIAPKSPSSEQSTSQQASPGTSAIQPEPEPVAQPKAEEQIQTPLEKTKQKSLSADQKLDATPPEQNKTLEDKDTQPVTKAKWPEGEELQTSEQVTACLQKALDENSDRAFRRVVRIVFNLHGKLLGQLINDSALKTHTARWLFADGHIDESLALQKQAVSGSSEKAYIRFLFKRLIDAGNLAMREAAERVMQELLSLDWQNVRLKEATQIRFIQLFIDGAYSPINAKLRSSIMEKIIKLWPQQWEQQLLKRLEQSKPEDVFDNMSDRQLQIQSPEVLKKILKLTFRNSSRGRYYEAVKSVSVPYIYSLYAQENVSEWMEAGTFESAMMDLWKLAPARPPSIQRIVHNRVEIEKRQAQKLEHKAAVKRKITSQLSQKNLIGLAASLDRLHALEPGIKSLESEYYQEIITKLKYLQKHYNHSACTGYEGTVQNFFSRTGLHPSSFS